MSDDFVENWRGQLSESLVQVVRLAPQAPEVDFASGLLATGILWPVRQLVQEYDGDAIDAIRAIAGVQSKHILRAVQGWDDNQLEAARALSVAARQNSDLAEALAALVTHFDAATMLSARLGAMPPEVVNQIKAALVNIGGIINIQSLTVNVAPTPEIPPPPRPQPPPEIVEFVGRAHELAYYAEMLATRHLSVISGMVGVGKTSLAAALARQTSPVEQIFWHTFHEREGFEVLIWKLAAFLAWHEQDALWRMLQSARLSGAQPPPPETLFDYLLQMLEGGNYLLCLDDLHLVEDDPQLVRLVGRLGTALVAARLSIIITARRIPSFVRTTEADVLSGLNAQDAYLLLNHWGVVLPEPLFERLYLRTGGNAQFMTLAMNLLHDEADPAAAIDRLAESDNVERYLLAEVDGRLSEEEQVVMGAVSVLLGYPASQDAIEALLEGQSVRKSLRQLADRHLLIVREGTRGREYQEHAMVQAFYYDLLGRARRRTLHLQAAAFYETDEPELLRAAIHFERGGNYARSAQLATQDLWALINQGQMRSLQRLLEQFSAAQVATGQVATAQLAPRDWINVNLALGQIYALQAEGQKAHSRYQEALDRMESLPELLPGSLQGSQDGTQQLFEMRIKALRAMAQLVYNDQPQEALLWLQRAFTELAGAGGQIDRQVEAALYIDLGWAHRRLHDVAAAMEALHHGLENLAPRPSALRGDALTRLAALYVAQFDLENARRYAQLAVENSRHLHDDWREQTVLAMLGNIKHSECDWPGAIHEYEGALELATKIGDRAVHAAMKVNLGVARANLGDTEAALADLSDGLLLSQQSNLRNHELKAQLAVAKLYMRLAKWDNAASHLDAADELVERVGSADAQFHLPLILSARAELMLLSGKAAEARLLANKSVALAIEQEKQVDRAVCQRVLAQVLLADGDIGEAQALLEESLPLLGRSHWYEAAKIKALLGQCLLRGGDTAGGNELIENARGLFEKFGAKFDLAELYVQQS